MGVVGLGVGDGDLRIGEAVDPGVGEGDFKGETMHWGVGDGDLVVLGLETRRCSCWKSVPDEERRIL